jgi:hypothetical protein
VQGTEFQVNTYTTSAQIFPAVAADADGDFVVVWWDLASPGQDGDSIGVFGQRYTSAGIAQGAEFQVNTYTTSGQLSPAVAADADGDFVVVWMSPGDSSDFGVFGQRFEPIVPTPIPTLSRCGAVLLAVLLMLPMVWAVRLARPVPFRP